MQHQAGVSASILTHSCCHLKGGCQRALWIHDAFGDTQCVKQFLVGLGFEER